MSQNGDERRKRRRVVDEDDGCDTEHMAITTGSTEEQGHKRHLFLQDNEGWDDGEIRPITGDQSSVKDEKSIPGNLVPCPKPRLVLLSVETSGNSCTKFALSEDLIREIPDYSRKLDAVMAQIPAGQRFRIAD